MELVYTEGCVCTGLTVDDKNYDDCGFTMEQKRDIVRKLIDKLEEGDLDNEIMNLVQITGKYKYIGHCDECGDSICEWTIKL